MSVQAAIFMFGADEKVWYRSDSATQPRDNVLIENGVFAESLDQRKEIICRAGVPRTAKDFQKPSD